MADDPRVQQLLDELLDSDATPGRGLRSRAPSCCPSSATLAADAPPRRRPGCPVSRSGRPCPPRPLQEAAFPRIPGYEVEAVLGRGGMGVVYKARHLRLNRTGRPQDVARRRATPARANGNGSSARPRRWPALRHPNIVQVYDVGDDGRPAVFHDGVRRGGQPGPEAGGHAAARPPGGRPGRRRWPRPCRRRIAAGSSTAT